MTNKINFNGKIELYRFIFTITIVLFHINQVLFPRYSMNILDFKFSFFSRGFLGVEFFFILSGVLMASSISRIKENKESLAVETANFIKKKIKPIWPYHVPAFVIAVLVVIIINKFNVFESISYLIKSIPAFFFINKLGFDISVPIGAEWYISVMIFSMLIIYPILRKHFEMFSKVVAPIIFLFLMGLIFHYYKDLNGTSIWTPFGYMCMYRGFAEICLGIFIFQLSTSLAKINLKKRTKILLTLFEYGLLIFILLGICIRAKLFWQFYILIAIALLVLILFSKQTYGTDKLNNKFIKYLGFVSLPIYLTHYSAIKVIKYLNFNISNKLSILFVLVLTVLFTYICIYLANIYKKINFKSLI